MKNLLQALLMSAVAFPLSVLAQTPSHDAAARAAFLERFPIRSTRRA
jgi:hypothetical protein